MRGAAVLFASVVVGGAVVALLSAWRGGRGTAPSVGGDPAATPSPEPSGRPAPEPALRRGAAGPGLATASSPGATTADARRAVSPEAAALAEAEALGTLRGLRRRLVGDAAWKEIREAIDAFCVEHPSPSEAVAVALDEVKFGYETKRRSSFASEAGRRCVPILSRAIEERVGARDVPIQDALAWARKEAIDEAFQVLTRELQEKDPAVTPQEAMAFWEARPKADAPWGRAGYGSGSFLVEPPTAAPPAGTTPTGSGEGAAPVAVPRLPTRDSWWANADTATRREWILAFLVEKSGLFELAPAPERVECPTCAGSGLLACLLSTGDAVTYLCPRCGGAKLDRVVRFR